MTLSLTFLGAARTVTGSKYLLETGSARVLVDAGLFQGPKELRLRNWQNDLPIETTHIDAIVLTHAHLDHCGYLPRLVSHGFKGRVFCTAGTKDLCNIVLPDSGRIQEEDAENANRGQYSKHRPALPLYTEADAFRALSLLQPVGYDRPMPAADGVEVDFINAGHLLGSSYARVRADGLTILFGGDLGRFDRPVLPDPTIVEEADYLLVESTYGDRRHVDGDDGEKLAAVIRQTVERGGRVIIPSFAIGRVEELIYWIRKLEDEKRIPVLPVFLDSPMAVEALGRYSERLHELDEEMQPENRDEKGPLGPADRGEPVERRRAHARHERNVCAFCTERFRTVASAAESKQLTQSKTPAVIISASGMATGGRVLHHLAAALPDSRNTVLFVGYQAAGTRGRRLVDGEAQVKIHGSMVPVRARIERIESMSAHADSGEILRWLGGFIGPPQQTFIVHGEIPAMEALSAAIQTQLGWKIHMPDHKERVELA
ncbi:MAG TPA: MBL fold metallo-hydrolase [Vicinamibacterales bacterium]|nr:MBL fold metallo-hydrolase [Vicinamibacterales bacterium]